MEKLTITERQVTDLLLDWERGTLKSGRVYSITQNGTVREERVYPADVAWEEYAGLVRRCQMRGLTAWQMLWRMLGIQIRKTAWALLMGE